MESSHEFAVGDQGCSRCQPRGLGETFRCYQERYLFDVERAKEMVSDGREPVQLAPEDLEYSLDRAIINQGHLAHVNPEIPGIVAHVFFPLDGEVFHGQRMIDGHHRAALCQQRKLPFFVHVLSEAESVEILLEAPPGARPDSPANLLAPPSES